MIRSINRLVCVLILTVVLVLGISRPTYAADTTCEANIVSKGATQYSYVASKNGNEFDAGQGKTWSPNSVVKLKDCKKAYIADYFTCNGKDKWSESPDEIGNYKFFYETLESTGKEPKSSQDYLWLDGDNVFSITYP